MLYRTVNNAIITLGDTDVSGKGKHFKSRFIQPGIAGYPGQFGNVLITKETLDKFINTMVGVPVIIRHKDFKNLVPEEINVLRVGVVSNVWFDDKDGWYWCEGVIWDETAQNLITEQGWSVSCSYDVLKADDEGGSENNIAYDMEFLDGVFTHLALVNNPRYERANIVFNSKTVVENYNKYHNKEGKFCSKDEAINALIEDIEPVSIDSDEIPIFKAKQRNKLGEYVKDIFQKNRELKIKDNGREILLSTSAAKRTYSKQNPQDKNHNAVYTKIKEIVERAKYFKFVDTDEAHPNVQGQELYYSKINIDNEPYRVKIVVDVPLQKYLDKGATYNYAGHRVSKIEIAPARETLSVENQHRRTETDANLIIIDFSKEFNPNERKCEEMDIKNWNESDHPRDEQGKFTGKGGGYKQSLQRVGDKMKDLSRFDLGNWLLDKNLISEKHLDEIYEDKEALEQFVYDVFQDEDISEEIKESFFSRKNFDKEQAKYYKRANNSKEHNMALIDELKRLINKVENNKEGDEMDKDLKEKEVDNEKVDKRHLLREADAIAMKPVSEFKGGAEEKFRTLTKLMEEMSYNESEAGTADNDCDDDKKADNKKVKNESEKDKEEVKELKDDMKKDVDNSVNNSKTDYFAKMNEVYNASQTAKEETTYVSRADKLKAGEEMFKV